MKKDQLYQSSKVKIKLNNQGSIRKKHLKSLISIGLNTLSPMIPIDWIRQSFHQKSTSTNNSKEKIIFRNIINQLNQYQSPTKMMVILESLPDQERNLFIRHFFKIVEDNYIDNGVHFQ